MFWRMAGLSTASPVETILDKDNFTLEELLDEDEIIQECKALNGRLINFLRERSQVEQLIRYIVEEAPEDAEKKRTFKLPFIACEIFTCEVDIILKALVEDEDLMNLLFSFLKPNHSHSTLLAGYFSKVVVCLLLRKTAPLMNYIKAHQEILGQLVDLIGITSIMEVLIRLIGADEHMYTNYMDSMQWIENTDVLEMIADKFSSSDSPKVHANTAEMLCAVTRSAPPGLAAKVSSPNFIGRLFRHALEESRPKSVLVSSLSIYISLLDPKRPTLGTYHPYIRQLTHASNVTASPETVKGMLESLGDLLKLLDTSSSTEDVLLTTYGKLQPPLGKHRLKIVEFISVLLTVGGEAAEKELIQLGAVERILLLFFEYPYNNFLHHHVESIIFSCLESKNASLLEHLFHKCDLVGKILEAEKTIKLLAEPNKPTIPADGRSPPRIGNIGHLTRISNKLIHLANSNSDIQTYLQQNSGWSDWHANVLTRRNAVENVYQWTCGRPTALHDRRDSDDDDYQDRDYDVAALANNLSQAFRYGIYSNDDIDETLQVHASLERDDEDVYFDDESAEVVISSLRLGDDQESGSLFTNSNWFAFEDDRIANERSAGALSSSSPSDEGSGGINGEEDEQTMGNKDNELEDSGTSLVPESSIIDASENVSKDSNETGINASDKSPVWVEWRETSDVHNPSNSDLPAVSNGAVVNLEGLGSSGDQHSTEPQCSFDESVTNDAAAAAKKLHTAATEGPNEDTVAKELHTAATESPNEDTAVNLLLTAASESIGNKPTAMADSGNANPCPDPSASGVATVVVGTEETYQATEGASEETKDQKKDVSEAEN
ncbi:hypothetical protein K2173_000543 [Erythroxylum novogranatense]|uniref:SIT4 phosphatase-associated family protein n=1 Tax=Erythroxylum novogranatense TaxID=1862640 RepID=A0AAV8SWQ6_9ROSI|nr:hypothetical protein K2173_000543 [Erythroxylum novogranatense]